MLCYEEIQWSVQLFGSILSTLNCITTYLWKSFENTFLPLYLYLQVDAFNKGLKKLFNKQEKLSKYCWFFDAHEHGKTSFFAISTSWPHLSWLQAKFRKAQSELEEADQRANIAEQALNKVRAKSIFSPDNSVTQLMTSHF